MSRKASASTGGLRGEADGEVGRKNQGECQDATLEPFPPTHPPSIGLPDPLKTRPSMSLETGVVSTWAYTMKHRSGGEQA